MAFPFLKRTAQEPPFRLLVKHLVRHLPVSSRIKADWDSLPRPAYAVGLLQAADEAIREDKREISIVEFGVAGGEGLLELQSIAAAVEKDTAVKSDSTVLTPAEGFPETLAISETTLTVGKVGIFL